jgi:hypothetical protein
MGNKVESTREQTANEFMDFRDVKGMYLYTNSGYIMCYLLVPYFNIDLLPAEEKMSRAKSLTANMTGDQKGFAYHTFPREIDLDKYKDLLKRKHQSEMGNIGIKHILEEMIREALDLSSNGENYEHQHFIKLWQRIESDKMDAERALKLRAEEFQGRYNAVGIQVKIIKDQEILKMCNLYGNAIQAPYETLDNIVLESTLKIYGI